MYIKLPAEGPRANEEGICGKLRTALYGGSTTAQSFEKHAMKTCTEEGCVQGLLNQCLLQPPGAQAELPTPRR